MILNVIYRKIFWNVFSVLVPFPTRPIVAGVEEVLATLTRVTGKIVPLQNENYYLCVFGKRSSGGLARS